MNKQTYRTHRRSVRDNGLIYTLRRVPASDALPLRRIYAASVDMLAWRASWIANPDTARANIIRLTSFIGA